MERPMYMDMECRFFFTSNVMLYILNYDIVKSPYSKTQTTK